MVCLIDCLFDFYKNFSLYVVFGCHLLLFHIIIVRIEYTAIHKLTLCKRIDNRCRRWWHLIVFFSLLVSIVVLTASSWNLVTFRVTDWAFSFIWRQGKYWSFVCFEFEHTHKKIQKSQIQNRNESMALVHVTAGLSVDDRDDCHQNKRERIFATCDDIDWMLD